MEINLLQKYNKPAPRYTSYPTVPFWHTVAPTQEEWLDSTFKTFQKNSAISLYIHLPFCENLCTYCGCNKRITKNHKVEMPYIDALLKEWKIYLERLPYRPIIKELHLGGGTPTFFSPKELKRLLTGIFKDAEIATNHSFSFEAHPSSTSWEHLTTLSDLGFNRLSLGIQDFDESILKIINRYQTLEQVENIVAGARLLGYDSINFDLIYGLPLQEPKHILTTIEHVKNLSPDRIAFYSYAHVPWVSPSQRAYSKADLPLGEAKQKLYELGKKELSKLGYNAIGLDHFALHTDSLWQSSIKGNLHRNFMGYTDQYTDLMIGLGASSISDSGTAFVQNEKKIEDYQAQINKGMLPIIKGHLMTKEDIFIRKQITRLMCDHSTFWMEKDAHFLEGVMERLLEFQADGLLHLSNQRINITSKGYPFIRNICMAFDKRLLQNKLNKPLFSQVI